MKKKPRPILIVEDQQPLRQAVSATLCDMGFPETLQAANGVDAMRILKSTPVAAVLSAWDMPGLSGLGLLRWMRGEEALAGLPFILSSVDSDHARARTAIKAGASEYLAKPYTARDLLNKVERLLGKTERTAPANPTAGRRVLGLGSASEREKRIDGLNVLVVDDVPDNLLMIDEILSGDYRTMTVQSGAGALALARSGQPPDLILLDVMMPEMDGHEVCRQLKADPATCDIPVIFLTGNDDVEDVVRGLEIGAVDYIVKPAEPGILKARIRTHLRLKLAYADLARQHAGLEVAAKLREDVERITQHDLKNPLNAIITGTDLLLQDALGTESRAEMLRLVQAQAWRALDLVNQSLNLYRMETGTFVLQPEPVDLAVTLETVRQETLAAFAGVNLRIACAANDGTMPVPGRFIVHGEKGLCHSLFGNLLRNAAEASPPDCVIDVRFSLGEDMVTVTIRNDGAVPAIIREHFFDKYVSAGKSDGTGLGTYSAKLVTEAQGGTIALDTSDAGGTVLTVRLPAIVNAG